MSNNKTSSVDVTTSSTNVTPTSTKAFPWGNLAKIFAGISAVGGVLLSLIGYVAHQAYLSAWGIQSELFPQATNEMIVTGFFALTDRLANIISALNNNMGVFVITGIAIAIYAFVVVLAGRLIGRNRVTTLCKTIPQWCSDLVGAIAVALFGLVGVPMVLAFITVLLIVPMILGDSFGRSTAAKQHKEVVSICELTTFPTKCVELVKDGKILAEGFMIESSSSRIALFDTKEKRVRILEYAGIEIRAHIKPK